MPAISYAPDRHSLSEGSWWWTKSQISLKTSSPNIRSGRKTRRIGDHSTQFGRCILQRIHFTDYIEITTAVVVPCGVPKSLLIHRYSFVIFTFSSPLSLMNRFDPHVRQNTLSLRFGHEKQFYDHSLPSADSRRAVVSYRRKNGQ